RGFRGAVRRRDQGQRSAAGRGVAVTRSGPSPTAIPSAAGSLRRHIDLDGDAVRVDDEELVQRPSWHFRLAKIDSRLLQSAPRALEIRGRERDVIEAAGSFRSLIAAADEMHDRAFTHIEPCAGKVERRSVAILE